MKKRIVFKDSIDDSEMSLSISPDNDGYILAITSTSGYGDDVWFSPGDFFEFLNECQQFYVDNERRKYPLPKGEK